MKLSQHSLCPCQNHKASKRQIFNGILQAFLTLMCLTSNRYLSQPSLHGVSMCEQRLKVTANKTEDKDVWDNYIQDKLYVLLPPNQSM